jgi:putative ATPase
MADPQALVVCGPRSRLFISWACPRPTWRWRRRGLFGHGSQEQFYTAYGRVQKDVETTRNDPVPAPAQRAHRPDEEPGIRKGYKYAHEYEGHFVEQQNLPTP